MTKKIKLIQPQEMEQFPTPKCCHPIQSNSIEEKYGHLSVGKGEKGLSSLYHYQITDEWVEVEKPHKEKLSPENRHYLALVTLLINKDTGEAVGKGTVSVNKLVQPYPVYEGNEIAHISQFTNIPPYAECTDSILGYVRKYLAGKLLQATGDTFKAIKPDFSTGSPRYFSQYGEKLKETETPYFEVLEDEGEQ